MSEIYNKRNKEIIILFALIFFLLGCEKTYQYGAETFFSTVNYAIAGGAEYPFTSNNNKFYTENFKVFLASHMPK